MGNRGFWCFDAKIYQHIPFEWPNTNALIRVWLEAFYWALCLSFLPSEVWFLLVSVLIFPVKFWDLFYPLLSLSSLLSISHDNTSLNFLLGLVSLFFANLTFAIYRACLGKLFSSLNFRHSSLITHFFTFIWQHHFYFHHSIFSHHSWVSHLSVGTVFFFFFSTQLTETNIKYIIIIKNRTANPGKEKEKEKEKKKNNANPKKKKKKSQKVVKSCGCGSPMCV